MPLRDHFRPPLDDRRSWEGLHGGWPMLIAMGLNRHLPPRFVAEPQVHHGSSIEIDVGTYESEDVETPAVGSSENGGGVATAVWAPPVPTLSVATDLLDFDEFEVRIYDTKRGYRLVAALEIVSPANKDRPESRRAFVTKCAALLQKRVSVAIVDLVTSRSCNLYKELMEFIDQKDLFLADVDPPLYAVSCRCIRDGQAGRLETWSRPLALGQPLPTLPLWLAAFRRTSGRLLNESKSGGTLPCIASVTGIGAQDMRQAWFPSRTPERTQEALAGDKHP
jgi:hypothetical protein